MFKQYLKLTKTLSRSFFRDKQTIFFVLIMPLIFMLIFGFLYSGEMQGGISNTVAVYFETETEIDKNTIYNIIEEYEGLKYIEVNSLEEGKEILRNLEVDMVLHGRENNLNFYYNPVRMQDNPLLEQQAATIVAELDTVRAGLQELIMVKVEDTGEAASSNLIFMFPGLIALGIASAGLFVIIEAFMHYKEKGVLKRMAASPMDKNIFLLSLMSSRIPGAFMSALLVLVSGFLLFNVSFTIDWVLFIPYIIVSTIIMMGFGALITVFTKTADSAVQVGSIFITLMIFFSGIYFPIDFLPAYFQTASKFLPLSYIARGLRFTMGVERLSLEMFILESSGLLIASLLMISFVSFKSKWTG